MNTPSTPSRDRAPHADDRLLLAMQDGYPKLDGVEWARMAPRMNARIPAIKDYRQTLGVGLAEARKHVDGEVLDLYFEMTGFRETNAEAIWHHHLNHYGPPCAACGKLLRTPRASFCAACGAPATPSAEDRRHGI